MVAMTKNWAVSLLEDIHEDGTKVFKYPMYRICLKENNKINITIEIL